MRHYLISLILLVGLAACQTPTGEPSTADISVSSPAPPTNLSDQILVPDNSHPTGEPTALSAEDASPEAVETPLPAKGEDMVELTISDLAERFSIEPEHIQVVAALQVEWPDTSLGCPQTDMAYDQVLTPGYLILLEAEGKQFEYHTDTQQHVILCVNGDRPMIPVPPGDIDDGVPWVPVD
ncbi:MAG TPA: hypothetical protein VJ965_13025 [Anaerolineales bacterium]|nr:hypothetical protein [Anaerolineales bacterium]